MRFTTHRSTRVPRCDGTAEDAACSSQVRLQGEERGRGAGWSYVLRGGFPAEEVTEEGAIRAAAHWADRGSWSGEQRGFWEKRRRIPGWFSMGWWDAGGAGGAEGEDVVGHGAPAAASLTASLGSSPLVPASAGERSFSREVTAEPTLDPPVVLKQNLRTTQEEK